MMPKIGKCIPGFVIAITLVTEIFMSVSAQECNETTTKAGKLFLECSNIPIESVPQEYNSNLEIMNLSFTDIHFFQENDFKKYPKLQVLEMRGLIISSNKGAGMPDTLWAHLTQLQYLDVSGITGDFKFPTKLPSSIKYLHINEFDRTEHLDLTMLNNLAELHMAQTTAKKLPKLNKLAPLVFINLINCVGMDDLHYKQMAPFCLLKTLQLDHHTQLTQPLQVEQCCGILLWVQTYNIKGIDPNLHCYEVCNPDKITISSEAEDERHDCLVRNGLALNKIWIRLLIAFVILLTLAVLGYVLYRLYKRFILGESAMDHYVEKEKMEEEEEILTDEDSSSIHRE